MSKKSQERRAKKRAAQFSRESSLQNKIISAERRAVDEILSEQGLTAMGICGVGRNAALFVNDILAKAAHRPSCACGPGCAWCCVLEVSAWPAEVLQLAAWMEERLTPEEVATKVRSLRHAVSLTESERAAGRWPRVPCPLLAEDRTCSVHEVRPAACAAFESDDAEKCRTYAEAVDPEDDDEAIVIPNLLIPAEVAAQEISARGGPPIDGAGGGVDFKEALAVSLERGAASTATAWLAGEDVFGHARQIAAARALPNTGKSLKVLR